MSDKVPGRPALAAAALAAGLLAAEARGGAPELVMKPLQVGAVQEFGMIQRGLLVSTPITEFSDEWVDHFGTFFTQEATLGDRLVLRAGLGGVFQWPKPEKPQDTFGGSQYKMFFVGPTVADAEWRFGGEDRRFALGGGMFPYKYNPDAQNLGEYLFRSGPYPSYLQTGGLTVIGDNAASLQGFRASARLGGFSADLLLTTETQLPPLYDWSLGLVAGYSLGGGLVELGAGMQLKRLLQVDPEKTSRRERANSYFERHGTWYVGQERHYSMPAQAWAAKGEALLADADPGNDHDTLGYYRKRDSLLAIAKRVSSPVSEGGWVGADGLIPGASYFTPAGTLVMGRFALDLKKALPWDVFAPGDLRLYAEVAVLGLKDYPVFYEDWRERMPVMAGVNLPTFGLLDLAAVQAEWFGSPNLNNTYALGSQNWAIPYLPEGRDPIHSRASYNDLADADDWAWSILLRRRLLAGLTAHAQVARDHLRTVGTNWFYGSRLEPAEVTHRSDGPFDFDQGSWYWMVQLAWAI